MKINFIGDSITAGAGASTIENGYVNLVGSLRGYDRINVFKANASRKIYNRA